MKTTSLYLFAQIMAFKCKTGMTESTVSFFPCSLLHLDVKWLKTESRFFCFYFGLWNLESEAALTNLCHSTLYLSHVNREDSSMKHSNWTHNLISLIYIPNIAK